MNRFLQKLGERILLLDGKMASLLQVRGLVSGALPEEMNLNHPEIVEAIHREFVSAGADIIVSNTFAGNRPKLASFGLDHQIGQINRAGINLAHQATGGNLFVAASIGPTGRFLSPAGDTGFDAMVAIFREQIAVCVDAGADLLIFESFPDICELRTALIAAKDCCKLPLLALLTFEKSGRTLLGTTPEAAAVTLDALGADVIGINGDLGADGDVDLLAKMRLGTNRPLIARTYAEISDQGGGNAVLCRAHAASDHFQKDLVELGVRVIGGGAPPQIQALRQALPDSMGDWQSPVRRCFLSSRNRIVEIGGQSPCQVIGERINPTGKKGYSQELALRKTAFIRREGRQQVSAGADLLDVNCGAPGVDEPGALETAVLALSEVVGVPLVLDSANPEALERGLKAANGKVLINSVSGDEKSLRTVLPLARKYGAAVIGLLLDQRGIPKTAQERLEIAKTILTRSREYGLPKQDVIIDCLVLPAGGEPDQARETLLSLRLVRDTLGLATVLGINNISFGLPARGILSATFFALALEAGLKAAILNPNDERMMETLRATRVLLGEDRRARDYQAYYRQSAGKAGQPHAGHPKGK